MAETNDDAPNVPGLDSLRRLFAKELWRHKFNSAGDAYSEIKEAPRTSEKGKIIEAQFANWQRGSVSAIKEFFPQYVELGCKYKDLLKSEPVEWAADRTWEVLGNMCGAKRLGEQYGHRLDPVRWWIATATEFNSRVNLSEAKAWRAPRWLSKSRSLDATNQLLKKYLDRLSLIFYDVLDEEKERARLWVALNNKPANGPQQGKALATVSGKPRTMSKRKALTKAEIQRRIAIFGAIQARFKGPKYCKILGERKLPIPSAWTESGCPAKYVDAYKADAKWQKRIQDEKSRYQKKYDQTPPAEREKLL